MKTLQETFDAISEMALRSLKSPPGIKIIIPAILLDGYTDRLRELGANPPTYEELKKYMGENSRLTEEGYRDMASMVISEDLRRRVINLELKAIREANKILPGWVITLPEVQAEIGRRQQAQIQGDPTGTAEDFFRAVMFPRAPGTINRTQKLIIRREGYSLYHRNVYPDSKILCAIMDHERDADPAGLIRLIRKAVNRILADSEKNDFASQPFFSMFLLQARKKAGLKNQFTTSTKILDCIQGRDQYTPQRLAHTVMGIAFDRHPDVMKKEIAAVDFSETSFDKQKPEYFKTRAKLFCDYMLAMK